MNEEYTARERALTLAHEDAESQWTSVERIIEVADKYLAFLLPTLEPRIDTNRILDGAVRLSKATNNVYARALRDGGIAG